jgi:hypothetical protein
MYDKVREVIRLQEGYPEVIITNDEITINGDCGTIRVSDNGVMLVGRSGEYETMCMLTCEGVEHYKYHEIVEKYEGLREASRSKAATVGVQSKCDELLKVFNFLDWDKSYNTDHCILKHGSIVIRIDESCYRLVGNGRRQRIKDIACKLYKYHSTIGNNAWKKGLDTRQRAEIIKKLETIKQCVKQ